MGYSRRATAEILEINLSWFRQLCTRFDLHQYFKPRSEMRPECKPAGKGWPRGKHRNKPLKYTDEYLLEQVRKYGTYWETYWKAPVSASIIQKRFGSWRNAKRRANGS